jgi:hypothetical protein
MYFGISFVYKKLNVAQSYKDPEYCPGLDCVKERTKSLVQYMWLRECSVTEA